MKEQTLLLPAGKQFVKFSEIATLVAYAMHPGHDADDLIALAAAGAVRGLKNELDRAAIHGVLPLKDPQTLAPCPFPLPMALVSVDDLRAYFKGRLSIEIEAAPGECGPIQAAPVKAEAPAGESVQDRNLRWYGMLVQELAANPRGAQARLKRRIAAAEGVTEHAAKAGIQSGNKRHAELHRQGRAPRLPSAPVSFFPTAQQKGKARR
jgi:hypothetical protein